MEAQAILSYSFGVVGECIEYTDGDALPTELTAWQSFVNSADDAVLNETPFSLASGVQENWPLDTFNIMLHGLETLVQRASENAASSASASAPCSAPAEEAPWVIGGLPGGTLEAGSGDRAPYAYVSPQELHAPSATMAHPETPLPSLFFPGIPQLGTECPSDETHLPYTCTQPLYPQGPQSLVGLYNPDGIDLSSFVSEVPTMYTPETGIRGVLSDDDNIFPEETKDAHIPRTPHMFSHARAARRPAPYIVPPRLADAIDASIPVYFSPSSSSASIPNTPSSAASLSTPYTIWSPDSSVLSLSPSTPSASSPSASSSAGSPQHRNSSVSPAVMKSKPLRKGTKKCPHCPKILSRVYDLERHRKTHNHDPKCRQRCDSIPMDIASQKYTKEEIAQLRQEGRVLLRGDEEELPGCGLSFSRKDALDRHQENTDCLQIRPVGPRNATRKSSGKSVGKRKGKGKARPQPSAQCAESSSG